MNSYVSKSELVVWQWWWWQPWWAISSASDATCRMYGAVDCDLMHRTRVSITTLRLLYWQRLFVFRYLFLIQNTSIEYCELRVDLTTMEEQFIC